MQDHKEQDYKNLKKYMMQVLGEIEILMAVTKVEKWKDFFSKDIPDNLKRTKSILKNFYFINLYLNCLDTLKQYLDNVKLSD